MIKIWVDNREIEVKEEMMLLQACLENGIYVPNLCYLEGMDHRPASCRLCFVEIDGLQKPVTACTVRVKEGLGVKTDTQAVRRLQRAALRLLLSVHEVDCANCPANKKCGLQRIAKFLKVGLKPKGLEIILDETGEVDDHPFIKYYPNRCVLCGRCIHVCRNKHGRPYLTLAKRGFDTVVSFYGETEASGIPCREGMACVDVCPVAALTAKDETPHL